MLLKSVGENGMNYSKAVTMEANPQNDSGDLIKQVDSTSKILGNNNITDFDQSMPRDNIEINSLGQDKDESEVVRQSTDSVSNALISNELLRKFDAQRESSSFLSNAVEQKERYSFLKPAGDPLLLINDGCQVTGISNNRDGLLDAFASQVNDFNTTGKAVELEREYIAAGNQNEQESEDNQAANESFTDINSKVAFKSTEIENTEGNNSNLDTQTSENETVIVENYIRVNILEDDEEFGATLIPRENAVTSRSFDTLHNLAKAYSDTTLVAYALEKDAASSVRTDFTNLKNDANALEGKLEDTKNSGDNGSGKDLLSVEIAKTSSVKPSCCSPTIVRDVPFHTEVEGINSPVQISTLPVHGSLISPETGGKIDMIKNITLDPDKPTTIENDTSFSFEVGNTVDMSEKVTSNQSKLSHGVLSSGTRKTAKKIDVGTKEEKSTKPRAKSTKWASTHKSCSDSVGISYTASSTSIGTGYSIFRIDEVVPKAKSSSHKKKPDSPFIQKSFLPDLNTSVSASTLVCQPFSDLQQVQLHAQIFVYSSLSENKPPVETYMKSAFREMDGGRRTWETAWRKSVDRYQTQKPFLNPETPLPSHSVPRVPEQGTKSPLVQSKVISTSASKSTSKFISSATPSTPSPLPFPLRNLTSKSPGTAHLSFNQALMPLDPNPSSQTRQFAYSSTPRIFSNTRPAPWVICSPSPALKLRHSLSVSAVDTVEVTPVRESSVPYTALFSSPMPVNIPLDPQGKTASVQKARKWKKARQDMEDNSESILVSQPALTPVVHRSPPITLPYVSPTTKTHAMVAIEKIVAAVPHNLSPHNYQMINNVSSAEIAKISEEVGSKIEQAKLQAEEAASLAASVVNHSQIIWNQLAAQENSSLRSELEAKLVAAAAAGSAATSVARAAAVVAKVASETALQAKLMADEAIDSAKTEVIFDAGKNLPVLNLGSTPEHKDKVHGFSLTAASDPAQIIVDESSVTTKRAKNLEAIMRAAGLAAEAVSHVGTLIAMGDPLPFNLSNLLEAGPDSSWKAYVKTNKLKDLEQSENAPSAIKKMQQTVFKEGEHQTVQSEENCYGSGVGKSSTFPNESQENDPDNQKENSFKKGSLVEVIFDEGRLKGGWFSARVLDVEDNKVHVSYNNLPSDDGSAQLKEWVSLDSETNRAPRIRNAHPYSVTQNVGTKKRRREVASDHVWEVDDHVDARMHNGWWGGIITEKTRLDETKLKVHFPDSCHSSVVPAWNLRTSLSWKDGRWKEWSRAKEGNLKQHEGDTLQEKRQKLDKNEANANTKVDGKVPSTLSEKLSLKNRKIAEELRPLNLFIKDTSFVTKRKRTGPQKFMKVSKYYNGSDKADKPNHGMDSLKFPKYLMPQSARPWRNTSITVPRGKQAADSTSVGVKQFRFLTANSRNAKQKDINTIVNIASYSEKRKPSSVKKGYIGVKRRLPPSISDELVPDASEPRRSSRIIQPTSRLLEGLQSSMMMSGDPTSSPEKSSKKRRIRGSSSSGSSRG